MATGRCASSCRPATADAPGWKAAFQQAPGNEPPQPRVGGDPELGTVLALFQGMMTSRPVQQRMVYASTNSSVRSEARVLLGFKVLFYTNSIEGSAVVSNLSRSGAYLVTRARLRRGQTVRLLVLLGGGTRQELTGCVVRCDSAGFAVGFDRYHGDASRLVDNLESAIHTRLAMEAIADLPPLPVERDTAPSPC